MDVSLQSQPGKRVVIYQWCNALIMFQWIFLPPSHFSFQLKVTQIPCSGVNKFSVAFVILARKYCWLDFIGFEMHCFTWKGNGDKACPSDRNLLSSSKVAAWRWLANLLTSFSKSWHLAGLANLCPLFININYCIQWKILSQHHSHKIWW